MKDVFFSIIVPIYNVEKYIDQCIESILKQTYCNFELLLIDDGSPDRCGIICDEYKKKDSRISVIHKSNGGLVSARKAGINVARGDYIVSVDGDDYISESLLAEMKRIIDEYRPQIIAFNAMRIENGKIYRYASKDYLKPGHYTGEKLNKLKEKYIHMPNTKFYKFGMFPGIALKVYERNYYIKYQLNVPECITTGEDFAVTMPAVAEAEYVYVSNVFGYYYRCNDCSITNTYNENALNNLCKLIGHIQPYYTKKNNNIDCQLSEYTLYRIFDILVGAARSMNNYSDYQKLTEKIENEVVCYTMRGRYYINDIKGCIIGFLIKHKIWRPFWNIYHI